MERFEYVLPNAIVDLAIMEHQLGKVDTSKTKEVYIKPDEPKQRQTRHVEDPYPDEEKGILKSLLGGRKKRDDVFAEDW